MVIPIRKGRKIIEQKQSARDIAINYFLNEIRGGKLMAGDKILNERKLSDKLGISRVPLREAICTLSTLGILEAHQGNGTYVSENSTGILGNIIKKYGIFNRSMVDEVFEARCLFEADAAKLAAQNRTHEDLNRLQEALIQHENALTLYYRGEISVERMMEHDSEIHLGIAASTHNNFILQMIEAIRHVTLEHGFFEEKFTVNKHHFKDSMVLHREIVEAIGNKNAERAYQKMQEHIIQIRSALDLETIRRTENENI
jgi:Transcriptional regulators